jgi:RimJ/RimL family protein N-acetyltransferase
VISLSNTPVLTTDRLSLRAPRSGDFAPWAAFVGSKRAYHIGGPMSAELAWRGMCHLTGHWVHRGYGMFILALKSAPDDPIGMAGPWFPEGWPETEIGWSIWSESAEGKGYAAEAAIATRAFAYRTLGWQTAVSYIEPGNTRSIALAERLGAWRDPFALSISEDGSDLVFRHPAPGELP